MPNRFLDTSAVAKLYHKEVGSEYIEHIVRELRSRLFISRLSVVELESVLAIKVRTGEARQEDSETVRRCFRADLSQQRLRIGPPIRIYHYQNARTLLAKFGVTEGLRTLDALQLAVALDLQQLGLVNAMVAADQRLCRVALLAGCPAINPEKPGSLII